MILTLYQIDPEIRLVEEFQRFADEYGPDGPGFKTAGLFVQGHPLFNATTNSGSQDTAFPRVGIEVQDETDSAEIGDNVKTTALDANLKGFIRSFRNRGDYDSESDARLHAQLEQIDYRRLDEFLNLDDAFVDQYKRNCEARVQVSGWASGELRHARKEAQSLARFTKALYPFVRDSLHEKFGVQVLKSRMSYNIVNEQFGQVAFGFEMALDVLYREFEFKVNKDTIGHRRVDVALEGSKSDFLDFSKFGDQHG